MFKYIKLANYLKDILLKKHQLKDIIYHDTKTSQTNRKSLNINPSVTYSNLSLILNNITKF